MRFFSNKSRFSHGVMLVLLVLSIAGVYFTLLYQGTEGKEANSTLPIIFTIFSVVLAIVLFNFASSLAIQHHQVTEQLEQLRKSIQESKRVEEEVLVLDEGKKEDEEIDYENEVKSLIPNNSIETNELFMEILLANVAKKHEIVQAVFFNKNSKNQTFTLQASYAYFSESGPPTFIEGETLPGQVAKNKVVLNLNEVPEGYITVLSGLGKGSPKHMLFVPVLNNANECIGVIEFASFKAFNNTSVKLFETLGYFVSEHFTNNSIKE